MSAIYRVNFEIANTEDLRQAFSLTDSAAAPIDLTGAQLKMAIEPLAGAGLVEASTSNGRIGLANAPAGQFELQVPASVMRTLAPGSYRHDLLLTLASGHVHRVWSGALTLARGVTQ